ncbi:hypothetical protein V8E54_002221 [Elaphomyces granulatus]
MSSFVALNVEPDEDIEEEVDDTKEIQIEEALKLYQNALKLHSQGPAFYASAREAYTTLFKSEIFRYPESISDYRRSVLQDTTSQDAGYSDEITPDALAEFDINDLASSALPQTIYLSYKNHGQFLLDSLRELLRRKTGNADPGPDASAEIVAQSRSAIEKFAEALERDDTDLDLWRKSARLGGALQSYRLARFCLESVLVGDDNELEVRVEQLGLEEAFAAEDLQRVLLALSDTLFQIPSKNSRKALLRSLSHQIDVFPYLPTLQDSLWNTPPKRSPLGTRTMRQVITPKEKTWTAVGSSLLQRIIERQNAIDPGPGALSIRLPVGAEPPIPREIMQPPEFSKPQGGGAKRIEPQVVETPEAANLATSEDVRAIKFLEGNVVLESAEDQSSIDQRAASQLKESLEGHSGQPADSLNPPVNLAADEVDPKAAINPRKRSSTSIGHDELADGGRTKSRRIRAREFNADSLLQTEDVGFDQAKYYEDRLEVFSHADEWVFGTVGALLSKVGVEDLGTIDDLKKQVYPVNDRMEPIDRQMRVKGPEAILTRDLRNILMSWDEDKSRAALQGDSTTSLQDFKGLNRSGLAIFLEHSRRSIRKPGKEKLLIGGEGLSAFAHHVNAEWLHVHEVALCWLEKLLMPVNGMYSSSVRAPLRSDMLIKGSTYMDSLWPEALKQNVVQIIIREDEFIYNRMSGGIAEFDDQVLRHVAAGTNFTYTLSHYSCMEMIQTLFELHLDIYASINNPNSEVDQGTRFLQRDRLARWSALASAAVNHFLDHSSTEEPSKPVIGLRHLWSSTFRSNLAEDASQEHILLCLKDLKGVLLSLGNPVIMLINNAVIPEISAAALDQEISRLNSMDFFMKLFGSEADNPVELIESIEPILEPTSVEFIHDQSPGVQTVVRPTSQLQDMAAFLDRGDATLRLFLWRRLQDAYKAIDYRTKVVSCYLRSIETIMKEIRGSSHLEAPADHRQIALLRWLKSIDDLLVKILPRVLNDPEKSFECLDVNHLRSSMSAVAQLSRLLHSFSLYDDSVRVGQICPLELRGALAKSLENFKDKLRDMQVRCWVLQYALLKEFMSQEKELFDTPADDRVHYLRSVHNAIGVRSACKYSDKMLLKLAKSDLLTLHTEDDYEADISQVLFDLHGLRFSASNGVVDHGCPAEKLDRHTAIMMIEFVMMQANRMSIKDVSKSELKSTIDKMQQSIGLVKHSSLTFNRRILSAYLKSPVNQTHLFQAVQGIGDLSTVPAPTETAKIAEKGWYFLLGYASLTKFRSQKRVNPVPTNDLDDAIIYFRQDLEHGIGKWETWYRLAQTYDSKLEEDITWSADKINNNRADLVVLLRNAIHCYTMAVAAAIRNADDTPKSRAMLSDLYTDFGVRMYSSSREPLDMGAFSLTDFTRHFSNGESQRMYQAKPFKEMRLYSVWNFASYLFRKAMVEKPKYWMNHYMLSKCLWKMFNSGDSVRGKSKQVEVDDVLDSLLDAIETLPERKDSRSEPIFEPHFRLVSIAHKLVCKGILEPAEASRSLSATPWARKVSTPEGLDHWKPYILEVLKNLRNADKSNWHHRIISRAAHVVYDDRKDVAAAIASKNELTQQTFTKTMTLQVWKPEFERPGRHFVYTTRYVYFFVSLLEQINDRASLDQLLRRVRKKQGDFINHSKLWEDICVVYAKLIRRAGNILQGHEEGVFKPISWEEFVSNSARLETWTQLPASSSPILDLLREAVELKKLNNNLMKVTMFEDLIADIYAHLYEINVPKFVEQVNEENRERMKVDHILMTGDGTADAPTPPTSAPASDAPVPRGRTKGIARRDIQRRAETIVNRNLIPRVVVAKTAAVPADEETRQASMTEVPVPLPIRNDLREVAEEAQSSVPGSIHDSADESELSEIDDEGLAKLKAEQNPLLFPNLPARKSPDPVSEISRQVSGDSDDGGEENEGEDEGEFGEGMAEDEEVADDEEAEVEIEGDGDRDIEVDDTGEEAEVGEEEGYDGLEARDDVDMEAEHPVQPGATRENEND